MIATWTNSIRFVLFDAVGTILRPEPSVGEAYFAAGRAAGSQLALDEVTRRFRHAFAHQFRTAGSTNDQQERQRWRAVIAAVFDDVAEVDNDLFPRLWNHFGDSANWRWFDDARMGWDALQSAGIPLGLASNYDSRLADVCRGLPPLDQCGRIFASSAVGWAKPSVEFFRVVEQCLECSPQEILLVGDDLENDYWGARRAGWRSIWLDRDDHAPPPDVPASDRITSLAQLPAFLGVLPPDPCPERRPCDSR